MTAPPPSANQQAAGTEVAGPQGLTREPVSARGPAAVGPSRLFRLRTPLPGTHGRLVGVAATAVIVGLWWLLTSGEPAETRIISPVVLPSPLEVVRAFPVLVNQRDLLMSIKATLGRVLQGFGLAIGRASCRERVLDHV